VIPVPPAELAWFPLVPRPRPPCLPLSTRTSELTALAAAAGEGTPRERATRAAAVLNKTALIASDCGLPSLARELCQRQFELFRATAPLPAWAVSHALQPVLNIPRQLIRDGDACRACTILETLHNAAITRSAVVIEDMHVDFAALPCTAEGLKEAQRLTWTALLADGTRALAQAGHWKQAAARAAGHRGTGSRLLDGRQASILALIADGQLSQAAIMTEQSAVTELWEHAVQALLGVVCLRAAGPCPGPAITAAIATADALVRVGDPAAAVGRGRIGLTVLYLAARQHESESAGIRTALIATAHADGYAARDILASTSAGEFLSKTERLALQELISRCGLDAATIPVRLRDQMMYAADLAVGALMSFTERVSE